MTQDAELDALFGTSSTAQPKPLGVPEGYSVPKQTHFGISGPTKQRRAPTYQQAPRYTQGQQYDPASMPADDIIDLQEDLVAAGLMEVGDFTYGVWDKESTDAYTALLSEANASGDDRETAMSRRIQATQANPKPGKKRQPLVVTLSNPDDLRAVAKRVSSDLYGGNLPDEDLDRFVGSYQQMEQNYQQAGYAMDETGGTLTKPPDPEVALEGQIRADHPNEVAATAFGARMDDIINTFTGGR